MGACASNGQASAVGQGRLRDHLAAQAVADKMLDEIAGEIERGAIVEDGPLAVTRSGPQWWAIEVVDTSLDPQESPSSFACRPGTARSF